MIGNLKNVFRDLIPSRYQVPFKYQYNRIKSKLEPEIAFLEHMITDGNRAIDIGGNRGVYAYKLWQLNAIVEVFEPNPTCFHILDEWSANKPSVTIYPVGLSSVEGDASLHIPIDEKGIEHDASASVENVDFEFSRDQLVPLKTLDSYGFENVCFVKIDVEGHEYKVIEGAKNTISLSRPAMLIEIEQRHNGRSVHEVFKKVMTYGYAGYFFESGSLRPLELFSISRHQSLDNFGSKNSLYINNFIFLHQDKIKVGEYDSLMSALGLR